MGQGIGKALVWVTGSLLRLADALGRPERVAVEAIPDPWLEDMAAVGNAILATGGTMGDLHVALAALPDVPKRFVWKFLEQIWQGKDYIDPMEDLADRRFIMEAVHTDLLTLEAQLDAARAAGPLAVQALGPDYRAQVADCMRVMKDLKATKALLRQCGLAK
jgi:hypothetical protein